MNCIIKNNYFFRITLIVLMLFILNSCSSKKTEKDFTFVFMTDVHLQNKLGADKAFRKAVDITNRINPDFVITGGDLIMDALENTFEGAVKQYKLLSDICDELKMPVYHTIGNHESFGVYEKSGIDPTHPEYGKKMFEKRIGGGKTYSAFNHKGWHFIILDTIFFTPDRKYTGKVDSIQLDWLRNDLKKIKSDTPIIVITHIPLVSFSEQLISKTKIRLPKPRTIENADIVLSLFRDHNLRLVLQGHLHIIEEMISNKTQFITGGAVCGDWWEGPRGDFEEGFVKITIKGNDLSWEYIDYGWEAIKE